MLFLIQYLYLFHMSVTVYLNLRTFMFIFLKYMHVIIPGNNNNLINQPVQTGPRQSSLSV